MRLKEFTIKNYKSLKDITLEFGNFTVFVGENGSGKTNVLEAIHLFFNDFEIVGGETSPLLQEEFSWYDRETEKPIELIAKFELSKKELEELVPKKVVDKVQNENVVLEICRKVVKPVGEWETVYIKLQNFDLIKGEERKDVKAYLFDPNASQSNLVGNRLIVIDNNAYFMDEYTDNLVKEGKVPFEHLHGVDYRTWVKEQDYNLIARPPKPEELRAVSYEIDME